MTTEGVLRNLEQVLQLKQLVELESLQLLRALGSMAWQVSLMIFGDDIDHIDLI